MFLKLNKKNGKNCVNSIKEPMKMGWALHLGVAQKAQHKERLRKGKCHFLKERKNCCKSREKNNAERFNVLLRRHNL